MNALDEKGIDWGEIILMAVIIYGPVTPALFIAGFWPWLCTVALMTVVLFGMCWTWGAAMGGGVGGMK